MLAFLRSSSTVLVIISSMSVPICNHFHARQTNSEINNHSLQGYPCLTPACAGRLESRRFRLGRLKSLFNAEYFTCRLSWSISSHFGAIHSWHACRSPKSRKKITKTPYLKVHGHSRTSMLTFLRSSSPVLVIISSMFVLICNHFHVRRANNSRIAPF